LKGGFGVGESRHAGVPRETIQMIDAFEATYFGSVPGWAVIMFIWGAAGILSQRRWFRQRA